MEKWNVDLNRLKDVTTAIARGDESSVDDLMSLTADRTLHPVLRELAEQIGNIVVQKEAREFRLEVIIEDLLHAHCRLEQANLDPLTGLPNRAIFHELLEAACRECSDTCYSLALMFIDLDKFKQVNDTMGHDAGDELLVQVAQRLLQCIGEHGQVARLGGDEFTVILPALTDEQIALALAGNILQELQRPFDLKLGRAHIGGSVGLSFFPREADRPVSLLKNADIAMYRAKEVGRNNCQLYRDLGKLL
ncbi:MAG: diguanylate cyclase [Desulfovibrio sp.]